MNRKDFIKACGIACIGSSALAILLESCSSSNYFAQNSLVDNKIMLKKTEFIQIEKEVKIQRKYVLIKSDRFNFPICIYKINEHNYSALLMECTHKSCELQPHGAYLICPCHGSEFSNTGIVQNPPAEENLKLFKTTTDNENIYIQL